MRAWIAAGVWVEDVLDRARHRLPAQPRSGLGLGPRRGLRGAPVPVPAGPGRRAGGRAGEEPPEPELALWSRAALGPGEQGARGDRARAEAAAGPGRGRGPRPRPRRRPGVAGRAGPGPGAEEEAAAAAEAWRPGRGAMAAAETKIIYHLDEQETPYLVKLPIPAERVTLGDFKGLLNRPNYKFYFKSMDDDFG